MNRRDFIQALGVSSVLGTGAASGATQTGNDSSARGIENVIVMVGDGMGYDPIELTRHVYGDLAMQTMTSIGNVQTEPRVGEVTDSAAAGTALATGLKSHLFQVSVHGPPRGNRDDYVPVMTQLEAADAAGMATGLVTTARLTHATPAAYAAHVPNRRLERRIAEAYLDQSIDVLLGGGEAIWTSDQLERARQNGYEVVSTAEGLRNTTTENVLGLFDESHIAYTLDRGDRHPGLQELTTAALDRLDGDAGFYLMVEGARIDHANHVCDPWTSIAETKEFDDTVRAVLEYASGRDDTLVLVTSDHECGGFTFGNGFGDVVDTERFRVWGTDESGVDGSLTKLADEIAKAVGRGDAIDVRSRIVDYLDLEGVELEEDAVERIEAAADQVRIPGNLAALIGQTVSPQLGIDWGAVVPNERVHLAAHSAPSQPVLAAGPGVEAASGNWFHLADLSASISAIMLFGSVSADTDQSRSEWERRMQRVGPQTDEDARRALEYLGPVNDDGGVAAALDVNEDGIVDLADVLAISRYDGDATNRGRSRGRGANPDSRGELLREVWKAHQ